MKSSAVIDISEYKKIVILTGAGISVASGLRPYRGPGGLWDEYDVEHYGHVDRLLDDPKKTWEFYGPLREKVAQATPNSGHVALANAQQNLRDNQKLYVITQNVDGLHTKAGTKETIEYHGNICKTRCSNNKCNLEPFEDLEAYNDIPRCPKCGSPLRPDIVLFGEQIPLKPSVLAKYVLRDCDLFIAVGTSGTVSPASNFVRSADYEGALTVYLNIEPMDESKNLYFKQSIIGKSEELLSKIFQFKVS